MCVPERPFTTLAVHLHETAGCHTGSLRRPCGGDESPQFSSDMESEEMVLGRWATMTNSWLRRIQEAVDFPWATWPIVPTLDIRYYLDTWLASLTLCDNESNSASTASDFLIPQQRTAAEQHSQIAPCYIHRCLSADDFRSQGRQLGDLGYLPKGTAVLRLFGPASTEAVRRSCSDDFDRPMRLNQCLL